jgi:hypothetical protein
MIPKPKKKNMHDIKNQRGIFLISVYRSLFMKLLLKDEYKTIQIQMWGGGREEEPKTTYLLSMVLFSITQDPKIRSNYPYVFTIVNSALIPCGKMK